MTHLGRDTNFIQYSWQPPDLLRDEKKEKTRPMGMVLVLEWDKCERKKWE